MSFTRLHPWLFPTGDPRRRFGPLEGVEGIPYVREQIAPSARKARHVASGSPRATLASTDTQFPVTLSGGISIENFHFPFSLDLLPCLDRAWDLRASSPARHSSGSGRSLFPAGGWISISASSASDGAAAAAAEAAAANSTFLLSQGRSPSRASPPTSLTLVSETIRSDVSF